MKQEELRLRARQELSALQIVGIDPSSLREESEKKSVPPKSIPQDGILAKARVRITSNFCKVDMDILDKAASMMDVYEQAVYRQLYRLSYGNGQNWCTVGYGRISKRANITRTSAVNVLDRLDADGWVKTVETTTKGKTYRIFLPQENGIDSKTLIETIPFNGIPSESIPTSGMLTGSTPTIPPESIPFNGMSRPKAASNKGRKQTIPHNGIPSDVPNIDLDHNIDLSPDHIIDLFYTGIEQKRISKTKREKGNKVVQELVSDDFSLEDIAYAAEWTPKNAKEKVYDMEILKHTIGEAISARLVEQEAANAARNEADRVRAVEEERRRLEGEIQEMRSRMTEDELVELREKALEEIRNTDEIKEQFITDMLITAKENEILQRGKPTK